MKKILIVLFVIVMVFGFSGCGNDKKAFDASKAAYDNINLAYENTEQFGSDLYEAWRLGIDDREEILNDAVGHLDSELSLTKDEIEMGFAYIMITSMSTDNWEDVSDDVKKEMSLLANDFFETMEDNLFSVCVEVVTGAYIANGKAEETQIALDSAKEQMKELSKEYSDYEHYPNLKEFYTTTSAFFDFCQNPSGSFEQLKDTINGYKNEARDYKNDLEYIFEE